MIAYYMLSYPDFPKPVPEASLNRIILDYPGISLKLKGSTGSTLLSKKAIEELCKSYNFKLYDLYNTTIDIPNNLINEWANRLAAFILNLWFGSHFTKNHIPEVKIMGQLWENTKIITCAGGLLSNRYGKDIINLANLNIKKYLKRKNKSCDKSIKLINNSREVNLNGLTKYGRSFSNTNKWILAIDIGHGDIKSRVFNNDKICKLTTQPMNLENNIEYQNRLEMANRVKDLLQKNFSLLKNEYNKLKVEPEIALISIATYMHNGEILLNRVGAYSTLRELNKNANELFKSIIPGIKETLLLHDGQAAALGITNSDAIIVFGTAIGYGFKPK